MRPCLSLCTMPSPMYLQYILNTSCNAAHTSFLCNAAHTSYPPSPPRSTTEVIFDTTQPDFDDIRYYEVHLSPTKSPPYPRDPIYPCGPNLNWLQLLTFTLTLILTIIHSCRPSRLILIKLHFPNPNLKLNLNPNPTLIRALTLGVPKPEPQDLSQEF